jgi:hypothetical protein
MAFAHPDRQGLGVGRIGVDLLAQPPEQRVDGAAIRPMVSLGQGQPKVTPGLRVSTSRSLNSCALSGSTRARPKPGASVLGRRQDGGPMTQVNPTRRNALKGGAKTRIDCPMVRKSFLKCWKPGGVKPKLRGREEYVRVDRDSALRLTALEVIRNNGTRFILFIPQKTPKARSWPRKRPRSWKTCSPPRSTMPTWGWAGWMA